MGGGAFKDEDKAMVTSVLGTKVLDKGSSSVSHENLLTTICSDENLQNKLSVRSVLESLELLQPIRSSFSTKSALLRAKQVRVAIPMVNEKIDENTLVSNSMTVERLLGDPKIFGQDLNNATWHGHSNYQEKLAVRPT
ncbi:hypothetical protein PVK06_027899 [Gossypium arboreum]|uniref:Uncharacterized protein n=1 Tax=Gossypium arboreum TaxID=29729 RepID=A0ABR0P411_GOSAR|nr:hypothetical protein PVK06_027899 [Gossypium arboreum]